MSEWISVKDRLPDKNEVVILAEKLSSFGWIMNIVRWKETTGSFTLTWNGDDYILNNDYNVYWMPLPEPPKEEKRE